MYICLKGCKQGFLTYCRPFLGVDECHLKGTYPGMCLVAIAMDDNNNLYPVAWAIVEVENGEVWCWFLSLLMEDLDKENSEGLTIMSDRKKAGFNIILVYFKSNLAFEVLVLLASLNRPFFSFFFFQGLLEAFNIVTPEAEIRYCVRHIWSNFKLLFGAGVFKDAFW
ncbi:hypothetical protein vseg_000751 [Gypsophila vaccaria]